MDSGRMRNLGAAVEKAGHAPLEIGAGPSSRFDHFSEDEAMSDLQQHQRSIAEATAAYAAASDQPRIQKQINDKTSEWASRNRTAGRWVAESDVAAEHSAMAAVANAELQTAAERVQETIALGELACKQIEQNAETLIPHWQRDQTRNAGDYVQAMCRLAWDNATALATSRLEAATWSDVGAEYERAIVSQDDVVLSLVESSRHKLARNVRPTLTDIEALFQLGRTIRQQQASRHPIEARVFRAFLEQVQPTPSKSLVLKLVATGKRKVA
jgi:hypothetical protein